MGIVAKYTSIYLIILASQSNRTSNGQLQDHILLLNQDSGRKDKSEYSWSMFNLTIMSTPVVQLQHTICARPSKLRGFVCSNLMLSSSSRFILNFPCHLLVLSPPRSMPDSVSEI
ncbi:hypothetical protein BCIN_13g00330 [Botrytis cinerea B05.10]|uniref:Uncharacterized protein n=1 Tax=Botryotinia fuckeliana (strain B05.10) TaxID=332648 RepID=A0A384K0N2_BOTFB|nr:hypothetical protein BCIN_13g00330 [Botrytis cinerea B05.10]ATZ56184.1 hypothetical protein BCIN_13g00330 [Botrytis cinerea B05.10]